DRIAQLGGERPAFFDRGDRIAAAENGRVNLLRDIAGKGFVAKLLKSFFVRSDEGDTVFDAGVGQVRVLGHKAVTRMDPIDAVFLGDSNDVGNIQVRADWLAGLTD